MISINLLRYMISGAFQIEELVRNVYIQFGAMGLFGLSGWVVAYLIRQDYLKIQAAYHQSVMDMLNQNKDIINSLKDINESLDIKRQIAEVLARTKD